MKYIFQIYHYSYSQCSNFYRLLLFDYFYNLFDSFILIRFFAQMKFRSTQRCSVKKVFLQISQNSQENTCARVYFLIKLQACNFIEKETLAQMLCCEFCEISKNILSYKTPLVVASGSQVFLFNSFKRMSLSYRNQSID